MKKTENERIFQIEDIENDLKQIDNKIDWKGITIHHAEYYTKNDQHLAIEIDKWHKQRGWKGAGYSFIVERDGIIYTTFRYTKGIKQAHCKGFIDIDNKYLANKHSIGICVSGHGEKQSPTMHQEKSISKLIYELTKYHKSINPLWLDLHGIVQGDKSCPGLQIQRLMYYFLDFHMKGVDER